MIGPAPRAPGRADTVGSLLRPVRVRALCEELFAGKGTQITNLVEADRRDKVNELNALAEEVIRDAVTRPIAAGLDVVSDGEMRRALSDNSLYEGIEGISPNPRKAEFTDASADPVQPPSTPKITGKVRKLSRVMGIVNTKVRDVESEDDLLRPMDEAASYLDPAQLAISPQCGFCSVWEGNATDEDIQWRKHELVGRVADRIWERGRLGDRHG